MRYQQEAVFETLRNMQGFLDDNGSAFDVLNQSLARKRLDEAVAQIAAHAVAQVGGRRTTQGETAKQRQLRLALRNDQMRPIAVIAGQKLREQPEFTKLRLPPWKVRGVGLTAAAHDMANAAEKYADLFVEEGLPSDFVAKLRAATDRLDQSIDARSQSRRTGAGATEGLKAGSTKARALIRVLDSLVRPILGTNDELLKQWKVAIHIRRSRTPASKTNTPDSPTPATGTTNPQPATAPTAATA